MHLMRWTFSVIRNNHANRHTLTCNESTITQGKSRLIVPFYRLMTPLVDPTEMLEFDSSLIYELIMQSLI